jgi:hypothetical protein
LDALDALADGQVLDTPPSEPAPPIATTAVAAPAASRRANANAPAPPTWSPPALESEEDDPGVLAYPRYIKAVGRSFAVFTSVGNVITFLILWFMLCVRHIAIGYSIWAWTVWVIIAGWYCCFLLRTVAQAAGEDPELPSIGTDDGWWDGILIPCFQMFSAYVVAAAPAVLYLMILLARIGAAVTQDSGAILAGGSPDPGPHALYALIVLFGLGMFIWPMFVLVVALGGGALAMFRLDLIVDTIRRAFPAYLLTVLAVYVGIAMQFIIMGQVSGLAAARANDESSGLLATVLLPFLLIGVTLFFDIVTMRVIGNFYCHFKHKFAWSWG